MIDVTDVLSRIARRDLDREGVPMLLTLEGAAPAPPDDPRTAEGKRLAGLLASVHADLARRPTREVAAATEVVDGAMDDDFIPEAAVSSEDRLVAEALSVLAFSDFGPGRDEGRTETAEPVPAGRGDADAGGLSPRLATAVAAFEQGRYVRVINYHNTPATSEAALRAELTEWGGRFSPVGVEDMRALFSNGTWDKPRPPLIPVFYEGYRNNAVIAAPICEEVGLIGWFFVITGFVDEPIPTQSAYADAHFVVTVAEERDQTRLAMTWSELAELSRHHVVNPHTAGHEAIINIRTAADFDREVAEPVARVREVTGTEAPAHAWLFGSRLGVSLEHDLALRHAGFSWCFSNTDIGDVASVGR